MNNIQIFKNSQFGSIRIAGTSEEPLFCLTDICKTLDLQVGATKNRLDEKGISLINTPTNGGIQRLTYVNEKNLYKVIMRSDKPNAEAFQDWVCGEVLPSIRKHGAYMTDETIEKVLTDPDIIISLATRLKESKERNRQLEEENTHKTQVIEGLVEDIPLADMRQRITQIIRKTGDPRGSYHLLYQEFNSKYHMNVYTRMNNILYTGSAMDFIDKELDMIPQLYDLTCKLFENSYEALMKSWGKAARRADRSRNISNRKSL